ncbi:DNA internalization-related competence protein ComEC/Rec2 [Idiomarina ramblicola]|uniref:DNA internalization-related competence protein ComEC/Rec2 n=1 Tax=Idiomarina ramblicola TaxID=263724 RepID=A0A432Z5S8_9GAMM|nr:DNA internalization-related competence protein ComEC/Rec2 [Idiomarina ramblicola]RUO73205.1 DNA internalization-related competence protein ComEC/Rec2 [Idiomarina ramblicola]
MDRWLLVFLGGILSASLHSDSKFWLIVSTIALLLLAIAYAFLNLGQRRIKRRSTVPLLMALFCGILWANANLYWQNLRAIPDSLMDTESELTLIVDEISRRYPYHLRVTGKVVRLFDEALPYWQQPRVRLNWYRDNRTDMPKIGQRWQLGVRLKQATDYRNHGSFRYRQYLLRNNIYAIGTIQHGKPVAESVSLRQRIFDKLTQSDLAHPGILAALTIGERSLLTPAVRETWQKNGLAHSLAISGLHLGMVAGTAILLFRFCFCCLPVGLKARERLNTRVGSLVFAAFVTIFYATLADFPISTVRALTMFLVVLAHVILNLKVSPLSLLLRVTVSVLIVDVLAWQDPGFWLSITAVAALFLASWRWQKIRGRFSTIKNLWSIQWLLLVVMSPLSFLLFGGFSLLAPVVNLLVLPIISFWLLPLALTGTGFAVFDSNFAETFWQLAELPLRYVNPILEVLAEQPVNWLQLNQWPITREARFALLLALIAVILVPVRHVWQRFGLLLCLPVSVFALFNQRDGNLRLHVLDVGQSQAVVLERNGRAMLIDTGIEFNSGFSVAESVIEPFLNYHGLVPEYAFISHGDSDHNGGRAFLSQRYPELQWRGDGSDTPCKADDSGQWNGMDWRVLWPTSDSQRTMQLSKNNRSCVLVFSFGDFSVFLPGDIEMPAEQLLLARLDSPAEISSDVMLVPHHGSKTSSSWPLLQAVDADIYLISYGRHRGYRFPHRYTLKRLSRTHTPWFGTKDNGQLTIISNGSTWSLELPFENR